MAIKKREDIAALTIPDEDKQSLFSIFDAQEKTNSEILELRKKNDDANKVVQKYPEMEKLLATKEQHSKDLQAKLDALTVKSPVPVVTENAGTPGPFGVIFETFDGLFGNGDKSD